MSTCYQNAIEVKKLHKDAVVPTRSHPAAFGLDIVFIDFVDVRVKDRIFYLNTGLSVRPIPGTYFKVKLDSKLVEDGWLLCKNMIIDESNYKDEIIIPVRHASGSCMYWITTAIVEGKSYMTVQFEEAKLSPGMIVAQLIPKRNELINVQVVCVDT